jgi:hypothetical protein
VLARLAEGAVINHVRVGLAADGGFTYALA